MQGALRHVLADALGSLGVIAAGAIVLLTGWSYADPLVALAIAVLVLGSSWTLLRESVAILLEAHAARARRRGDRPRDDRRPGRPGGARPARLDDHLRVPVAVGARARRAGLRLPREAARARVHARRAVRPHAHDPAGRPRRRGFRQRSSWARQRRAARRSSAYDPVVPSLEGKPAIVTGASSGIGAATVRALREEGMRVAGGARRTDRIDADVALELDVTDPESCERFVAEARRAARRARHPRERRRPRARARSVLGEQRRRTSASCSRRTSTG